MRYEQNGNTEFSAQFVQQIDYLRLYGYVQSGNGFVGYNEFRFHDHRTRNAYSLTLTAGKLMRISPSMFAHQSDFFKYIVNLFVDLLFILDALDNQSFRDDIPNGHSRIKRSDRILKDHLNPIDDSLFFRNT